MLLRRYQVRGRPARSAVTSRSPTSPHPPGIPVRTFSYLEPFLNPLISVGHFTPLSEKPEADQVPDERRRSGTTRATVTTVSTASFTQPMVAPACDRGVGAGATGQPCPRV